MGDCCCRQFAPPMEQLAPPATTVTTTPTSASAPALQLAYSANGMVTVPSTATVLAFPEPQLSPQLQAFWANQMAEIMQLKEIKNHSLPLARIKKIMKADEDVKMIAAEAPVVFSRACEMFILEITLRAWNNTAGNKRRTLQKSDVAAAITQTDIFDFLVDIVPRDDAKEGMSTEAPLPCYYFPPENRDAAPGTAVMTLMQEPVDQYAWEQHQFGQQNDD